MEPSICDLICTYKKGQNKEDSLLEIIDKFNPLVKKYAKKFPHYEYEDIIQELVLAIIEAVHKIKVYEKEGQCIKYISISIKRKFGELYRKRTEVENSQIEVIPLVDEVCDKKDYYKQVELYADLYRLQKAKNLVQSRIAFYIIEEDMSDAKISQILGVSRQYVNRCKKDIFKELKSY